MMTTIRKFAPWLLAVAGAAAFLLLSAGCQEKKAPEPDVSAISDEASQYVASDELHDGGTSSLGPASSALAGEPPAAPTAVMIQ